MQYTLKELRARSGLTQEDMANRLGISRQGYARIEKHPSRVSCERMLVIADIFGVGIDQIFLDDYHTNSVA